MSRSATLTLVLVAAVALVGGWALGRSAHEGAAMEVPTVHPAPERAYRIEAAALGGRLPGMRPVPAAPPVAASESATPAGEEPLASAPPADASAPVEDAPSSPAPSTEPERGSGGGGGGEAVVGVGGG